MIQTIMDGCYMSGGMMLGMGFFLALGAASSHSFDYWTH